MVFFFHKGSLELTLGFTREESYKIIQKMLCKLGGIPFTTNHL